MKISKERFNELGLGCSKRDKLCCTMYVCGDCEGMSNEYEIADCVDEERLRDEMTEEEYDAFRHNRLEIEED